MEEQICYSKQYITARNTASLTQTRVCEEQVCIASVISVIIQTLKTHT